MQQHAPTTSDDVDFTSPPTYGALMTATREAIEIAMKTARSSLDPEAALEELAGYERFLRVAGNHLKTLVDASGASVTPVHNLARRLSTMQLRAAAPGAWMDAAAALGAGHDLVASHLNYATPRTPEGEELIAGPASMIACAELLPLMLDAQAASEQLIQRFVIGAKGHIHEDPHAKGVLKRLRTANNEVDLLGKAAMWELTNQLDDDRHSPRLDALQTAATPGVLRHPTTPVETALEALRLLRQLSLDQTRGRASASPASLRDLALLGAKVTDPEIDLPEPTTSLGRVRTAHARDQLTMAHAAWAAASTGLTHSIRGVTRAPSSYRAAIDVLFNTPGASLAFRAAVAAALPQLGHEATQTVNTLTRSGALATRQQVFAQPRQVWAPITAEQGAVLAGRFNEAAHSSRAVAPSLRDLVPQRRVSASADAPHRSHALARERELVEGPTR